MFSYKFKIIFSLPHTSFITADLIMFLPSFFSCHYYSFECICEVLTFPKDTTENLRYCWHLIVLHFLFHGLHFTTTLRVLKPVLYFHMKSFNYGAKDDVDPTCRCHQSNIMPDSIFSVDIAQCIACG